LSDLLSKIWLDDTNPLLLTLQDWERLLSQAGRGALLARLSQHLSDTGLISKVPLVVAEQLAGPCVFAARHQIEVIDEVERIKRVAANCTTTIVLLKGAAYLVAGLPPSRGRFFSDIDLMVRREEIPMVESALLGAGWISKERDPYNQRYYRRWMHEVPPLVHVIRASAIDLHHTITPPTSRFAVDANMLYEQLVPTRFDNVFTLGPADMVLHSAVHLFQEGEFRHGLRDLLDLKDLLQFFGKQTDFWPKLLQRANELGLQIPLSHALFHVERLFKVSPPPELAERVRQLGPSAPQRHIMAWLLGLALKPDHPSCDTRWTGLARWLLYVRSHALRMPVHLAVPHLARKAWMRHFQKQAAH
jgi:hypothetical protein